MAVAAKLGILNSYGVTVQLADGGGTVECRQNQWPSISTRQKIAVDTSKIPVEQTVLLPPRSWRQELTLDARLKMVLKRSRELGLSRIVAIRSEPLLGAAAGAANARPDRLCLQRSELCHALRCPARNGAAG